MKRAKLGDIYTFKTERGYRIMHWAYRIEKYGKYVRVMPGFYDEIPEDVESIVNSECSYIMSFAADKAYRKGIFSLIGNVPISDEYPFPKYDIMYYDYGKYGEMQVSESTRHQNFEKFISDPSGSGLPEKYKNIKLVLGIVDPIWFLYLISSDFDMKNWQLFQPREKWDEYDAKYGTLIFGDKTKA